ncbi:SHOCT domain-containing protein [Polymorphobacter fuscus]|uniref:SHOCT domain-containing protein n=1 Tax=Sandarakinorhabdus fusca TaxID=1439888 RepID=A0A7C9GTV4_9SPHN|nr:SHOCT domain-containing protein [Polymorphobacter fuscus]KAB7648791.1 SHOCT domain-containing protein [Polymorphobacter fuscus]MQT16369.1 SHOCT domain-containing protein [Polymorphobacter fuscus]NJC07342.1 hypothetical protein [Polymorphobacter fuscus]
MFGSRRGRPSLIGAAARTAGRTAVVVGTANAMTRPRGAPAAAEPGSTAPAAGAAAGLSDDSISRLKQIAELHAAGVLTDAEFAEQKSRLLNG